MADKKKGKKKSLFSKMFSTPGSMASQQSKKGKSESLKRFQKGFRGSGIKKSLMGS
jgi:hypothetical protein